jgi:hypothetical protein
MSEGLIEFHTKPDLLDIFPRPYPASQCIPEWYRRMPPETEPVSEHGTVKRCPPFLEAMTCGYIIPLPADVKVTVRPERLDLEVTGYTEPLISLHPQSQFPGAPFPARPVIKFRNPWIIKTPVGYSTLFIAPLNRFEAPFVPLAGLVETDTYYRNVSFPAVWLLEAGSQTILPRGMPLVQVIPVKRDEWKAQAGPWDLQKMEAQNQQLAANRHMYKEQHWVKKRYG